MMVSVCPVPTDTAPAIDSAAESVSENPPVVVKACSAVTLLSAAPSATDPALPVSALAVIAPAAVCVMALPGAVSVTAPPVTEAPSAIPPAALSEIDVASETAPLTVSDWLVASEKPPVLVKPARPVIALPLAVSIVVVSEWPLTTPVMLPPFWLMTPGLTCVD